MTEINNNIHNYGYNNIERVNLNKDNLPKQQTEPVKEEDTEQKYVPDTGILGRSQVVGFKGGNIDKSVDEAVHMAENEPVRLQSSEELFDKMYKKYLSEGLNEADAYLNALLGEEEFLDITFGYKK